MHTRYPLHAAAEEGHTELALKLLADGVDVNDQDQSGWTPLHFAAKGGHVETALALVNAGGGVCDQGIIHKNYWRGSSLHSPLVKAIRA